MNRVCASFGVIALVFCTAAGFAQTAAASDVPQAPAKADSESTTIHGCLQGQRGNYIVVEKTGMVLVLKGVGNKLDGFLNHEVAVKGEMLPGTIKTGIRPEKAGSSPSDTLHGIDGTPFQVRNPQTDVQSLAKHCKAADAQ